MTLDKKEMEMIIDINDRMNRVENKIEELKEQLKSLTNSLYGLKAKEYQEELQLKDYHQNIKDEILDENEY